MISLSPLQATLSLSFSHKPQKTSTEASTATKAATSAPCPSPSAACKRTAAFAPGAPTATQSRHAAYISTTNAWPSGLCSPSFPMLFGFTTGVSHMSDVKCASEAAVDEDAGAVLVEEPEGEEGEEEEEEEEEGEEEDGAERAERLFSARGRCVWMPERSARR